VQLETIDSVKHPLIQSARALATRSGRLAAGRVLAEGTRLVIQIIDAGSPVEAVLVPEGRVDDGLRDRIDQAGVALHTVRPGVLRHVFGSATPPECLAILPGPDEQEETLPTGDLTIVCDGVADPGNIGAIIRTARGLGCAGVVVTGDVDPGNRRVVEASRGAVLRMSVHRFTDGKAALRALRAAGWWVAAADARGDRGLRDLEAPSGRRAVIVGNETDGLRPSVSAAADVVAAIELESDVESLNVAVAAGIALYALRPTRR
jgi:TrmH family RNA methyltransferase